MSLASVPASTQANQILGKGWTGYADKLTRATERNLIDGP